MKFKGELVLSQALEELNRGYAARKVSYVRQQRSQWVAEVQSEISFKVSKKEKEKK